MDSSIDSNEKKGRSSRENSQTSGIPAYQPSLDSMFPTSQHQIASNDQPIVLSKQPTPPVASVILNETSNHEEGTEPITTAFQIASTSLHPSPQKDNPNENVGKNEPLQVRAISFLVKSQGRRNFFNCQNG